MDARGPVCAVGKARSSRNALRQAPAVGSGEDPAPGPPPRGEDHPPQAGPAAEGPAPAAALALGGAATATAPDLAPLERLATTAITIFRAHGQDPGRTSCDPGWMLPADAEAIYREVMLELAQATLALAATARAPVVAFYDRLPGGLKATLRGWWLCHRPRPPATDPAERTQDADPPGLKTILRRLRKLANRHHPAAEALYQSCSAAVRKRIAELW
jgi:hypothetical protein